MLLDDDFSSIVAAVRLGRRIFDNLKKAVAYIFAVHTPIIGLTLIPLVLRWPLIFSPVHVVFLELIIDPACSVVFEAEPEEKGIMNRRPRRTKEPLFGREGPGHERATGTRGPGHPGRDLRDLPGSGTERRPGPGADVRRADRREPGSHPDEPVVEPGDRSRLCARPTPRCGGCWVERWPSWDWCSTCPRSGSCSALACSTRWTWSICLAAGACQRGLVRRAESHPGTARTQGPRIGRPLRVWSEAWTGGRPGR